MVHEFERYGSLFLVSFLRGRELPSISSLLRKYFPRKYYIMRRVPVFVRFQSKLDSNSPRDLLKRANVSRKTGQKGRKRSNKWIASRYNRDRKCHLVRSSSFSRRALCSSFPVPEAIFNYRETSARASKGKWDPRTIPKLYFIPDKLRCFSQ